MLAKDAVGRYGESVALRFLEGEGMRILARNWRCRWGEIDIVAVEADTLVVCEVKTRRGSGFGSPLEAVTPRKVARLRVLAGEWVHTHPCPTSDLRIDVVGVLVPARGTPRVDHLRGVS